MSDLILLATEAADGSSGMDGGTIAVVILLVALAVFGVAYLVVGPGRRRGPKLRGDIPLAMRPYHSDEELETTGLERAMAWGVALSVFMAIFLPLYWLVEPARIDAKLDEFYEEDVAFGRSLYAQNCTTCHGEQATGGSAPHPDPEVNAPWPAPDLTSLKARYEGTAVLENLTLEEFVVETIKKGRPGSPMPAWGSAYNGPMNDQQVEAITRYLLSIQDDPEAEATEARAYVGANGEAIFADNCAKCHGQQAEGYIGPDLTGVFQRYGAQPGDEDSIATAAAAIESLVRRGVYRPEGTFMPPWEGVISDSAISRVVEYLKTIQQPALD